MTPNDPYKNWPHAVLIAIDQLGNALAGGHPVTTISARVGFFSANAKVNAKKGILYWQWIERLIDFTFYPIDGPRHCYHAWQSDQHNLFRMGNDLARIILSIIMIIVNPIIALALRLAVIIIPSLSYKKNR